MSFFMNESTKYANVMQETLAAYKESYYTDPTEHALACVAESQELYSNMIKEIGVQEMTALYESGDVEAVHESGDGIVTKIKNFIMSVWEKIKALFARFVRAFDGYFKSGKEFVEKYKKQLASISHNMSDFRYKGYKFTIVGTPLSKTADDVSKVYTGVDGMQDNALDTAFDDFDDHVEGLRGEALGGNSKISAQEFTKELFEKFRDGSSEKTELELKSDELGDLISIMAILEDKSKTLKDVETANKNTKKIIDGLVKDFDKSRNTELGKKVGSGEGDTTTDERSLAVRKINLKSKYAHAILQITQTYNGAYLTALKDRMSQCKSVCVAALAYKPKNESYMESTLDNSIFGSITLK